eukprot:95682-Prymnesium_polylepis.1
MQGPILLLQCSRGQPPRVAGRVGSGGQRQPSGFAGLGRRAASRLELHLPDHEHQPVSTRPSARRADRQGRDDAAARSSQTSPAAASLPPESRRPGCTPAGGRAAAPGTQAQRSARPQRASHPARACRACPCVAWRAESCARLIFEDPEGEQAGERPGLRPPDCLAPRQQVGDRQPHHVEEAEAGEQVGRVVLEFESLGTELVVQVALLPVIQHVVRRLQCHERIVVDLVVA